MWAFPWCPSLREAPLNCHSWLPQLLGSVSLSPASAWTVALPTAMALREEDHCWWIARSSSQIPHDSPYVPWALSPFEGNHPGHPSYPSHFTCPLLSRTYSWNWTILCRPPYLAVCNSFSRWSEPRSAWRRSSESRPRRTETKSRGPKRDHLALPTHPTLYL